MTLELLAGLSWTPGFRGLLSVLVGVVVLYGSVALILGTNSGARLGFQLALTGLAGWFFVMGFIWAIYGIGYLGPAPSWKVIDTIQGPPSAPDGARVDVAATLPLPSDLPDPVELRDADEDLLAEFPADAKDPLLGDLAGASEEVRDQINEQIDGGWVILETSNKFTGETQAATQEYLVASGLFESTSDFVFLTGYLTGGETPRTDDSTLGRAVYEVVNTAKLGRHDPFYAAVQLQAVIPQETKPGQAPPQPVVDEDAPVVTVVLHRDRGALRQPTIGFTIASGLVFAVLAQSLHRRDKLADKQRAAPIGGA
ncbi:MAG: hypothetical protein KA758_02415 [Acidimicrobiales bacterium]|jgi:hypothetical protein|nr:hypothetical protein [Acidimicrobiales bacterium]